MKTILSYSKQNGQDRKAARMQGLALCSLLLWLLASCSTTNIPEDDQLFAGLKKIKYEHADSTLYEEHLASTQAELEAALATAPNGAVFGSPYYRTPFPISLWIYNSCNGSKSKFKQWLSKTFGKPPVLMSTVNPALRASVAKTVLRNNGYLHGDVNYEVLTLKNPKEAKVAYSVRPDTLFLIDSMSYNGFPAPMKHLIDSTQAESYIEKNAPFSVSKMDAERTRLTQLFRNNGYYFYNNSYASYLADTFEIPNKALLRLQMADSLPENALKKWYIGKMNIRMRRTAGDQPTDSIGRKYLTVYYSGKRSPIRTGVILRDLKLRPRELYSYDKHMASAQNINSVGLYSSTDFQFTPRAGTDTLDMTLTCTFDKPYDFYIEGNLKNRTIGRMGPELKIGVTRRNAFRGGEKLDINLHGSYEWQTNGNHANSYAFGADASVEFPRIIAPFVNNRLVRRLRDGRIKRRAPYYATPWTKAKFSYDIIMRPNYYRMNILSAEWGYNWQNTEQNKHQFIPLTLKYQYKSSFTEQFMNILVEHPYLLTTMDDYLIPKMQYTYTYVSRKDEACPFKWETTLQESGNITSLIYTATGRSWNEKGKKLFRTQYSQFLKFETDYTKTWPVLGNGKLVIHGNFGYLWTFGNSSDYPFTEGFYIGGANSVRAFPARSIGPGSFPKLENQQYSYLHQHGNMKLLVNLELRYRLFGNLHGALFFDAGNVWTTRDYTISPTPDMNEEDRAALLSYNDTVDELNFSFSRFPQQLATGTGIGLRYDLEFLVLRVDWGFGFHVPYKTAKSGYFNIEKFADMHTLHIAIGYPF